MIICAISNIEKSYGGTKIIDSLSFDIHEGFRIGLVGPNGTGKTTIMKMIAGVEEIDGGVIHRKRGMTIGYLAQIPTYPEGTTAMEVLRLSFQHLLTMEQRMKELELVMTDKNTSDEELSKVLVEYGQVQDEFTRLGGYEIESSISAVATGLGIDSLLQHEFNQLSGGEKTKVSLGLILLQKPELLLLDEPTNHLDVQAIEWLEEYIRTEKMTVLIVSHDRYFLDQVVTHIYDLDEGEISVYQMNYSQFVSEKEKRLLDQFEDYKEQQKKIKKMRDSIRRFRQWGNESGNEKFYRKAKTMERALDRMEKIKRPILEKKRMSLEIDSTDRSGKDVFIFENVSHSFNEKLLVKNFTFTLQYKDRAAIVGQNGTGKSTLLKMILGEVIPSSGTVRIGSNVKIGYLAQHIFEDSGDKTVIDSFREAYPCLEGEARHILARFLFYGPSVFKKVVNLSGGERMRLRLAQLMHQDINVMLLDEPTNHLDIDSREVLEEALADFEGTILSVSHDRYFLNKLMTKILWLEDKVITPYIGIYDEAKQKRRELKKVEPAKTVRKEVKEKRETIPLSEVKKMRSLEEIELDIEMLEREKSVLEKEMLSEGDLMKLQNMQEILDEWNNKLEILYEELEFYI